MSRAQWLAFGSTLAVLGCSGGVGSTASGDTAGEGGNTGATCDDGGASASGDASVFPGLDASIAVDAGSTGDAVVAGDSAGCPTDAAADTTNACNASGSFACAQGITCDRATQYCQLQAFGDAGIACYDDDAGGQFPSQCYACPTCKCVSQYIWASCHCVEIDNGAGIGIQCAACYGSPPTRLDRLGRRPPRRVARAAARRRRNRAELVSMQG